MDESGTTAFPTAVIVMGKEEAGAVLDEELRTRLVESVTVTDGWDALGEADVLITGWGCPALTERTLAGAPRLRAIVHAGGSVKWLVPEDAWDRGIVVSSAADANAGPVADYAYACVVLASKQALVTAAAYAARGGDGGWPRFCERQGADGRTVGVIGASRIGHRVLARLSAADAGYRVLLYDPYVSVDEAHRMGAEKADLETLCGNSSVVTLHAPDLPATRHMLDAHRLALVPDGGTIINTARGALVDTEALTAECRSGRLSAVLDVTEPEPLQRGHPLFSLPNVLVTPHIAGAQGTEVRRLGLYAVQEVERWVRGLPLLGRVERRDLRTSA
ncbi:hydroxyacid dehydrogenase [Streptomyces sp. NPDC049585]|uniref:hydroxyacid dehydrogenase n=1 Tax=Streptomyces sp. NPDC049585 TaxID=3155154 RepID=UPI003412CAFC